uniref:Tissue factor pathway inhibitor 2 n=1 Tax=Amazona collaria TaxID=241587 RepID=A0A8B9FCU9_9PSIT
MAAGYRLPLPALLLPLTCAALAPRTLTGRSGRSAGPRARLPRPEPPPLPRWLQPRSLVSPAEKQRACLLPPDEGPCRALVPRWYYDRYTQSCQEFTYGGCHGNANNFLTLDDCEKSCWTIKSDNRVVSTTMLLKVPKLCRMEADGGPCRSHLRRYAFNLSSMMCEEFIYGGCYGNGNNFRDLQACADHCLPEKSNGDYSCRLHLCNLFFFFVFFFSFIFQAGPSLCYSPKDEGLCSSSVPRYYYDTKTKSCKQFRYTGCGGNANNFVTETDCYNVCRKGKIVSILFYLACTCLWKTKEKRPKSSSKICTGSKYFSI